MLHLSPALLVGSCCRGHYETINIKHHYWTKTFWTLLTAFKFCTRHRQPAKRVFSCLPLTWVWFQVVSFLLSGFSFFIAPQISSFCFLKTPCTWGSWTSSKHVADPVSAHWPNAVEHLEQCWGDAVARPHTDIRPGWRTVDSNRYYFRECESNAAAVCVTFPMLVS